MSTLAELEQRALSELSACADEAALRAWNTRYFGDKGEMKAALARIRDIPPAEKRAYGQQANALQAKLTGAYDEALAAAKKAALERSLATEKLDVTLPGRPASRG